MTSQIGMESQIKEFQSKLLAAVEENKVIEFLFHWLISTVLKILKISLYVCICLLRPCFNHPSKSQGDGEKVVDLLS